MKRAPGRAKALGSTVRWGLSALLAAALYREGAALAEPPAPAAQDPKVSAPDKAQLDTSTTVVDARSTRAPTDPKLRRDPATYRGRETPTTAVEVLAWFPRVAFFPAYLVTEYGVRVPLYKAAELVERHHVDAYVMKALHPHRDVYWSPVLTLDLGAITFLGAQGKWDDVGLRGHQIKALAAYGFFDAWRVRLQDRWELGRSVELGVKGALESRWDRPFYGLGPRSGDVRTNFTLLRGDVFAFQGIERGNHFKLKLSEGYRREQTSAGRGLSIETRFPTEDIPGFGDLHLLMATLDLTLDSRRFKEESGGIRFAGNVTYGRDVVLVDRQFVTAAADFEVAAEISYPDRVLAARLYAMDTQPFGATPVPFTHQASLGGDNHHGFLWGRFRGESAIMAELRYRYPIAYYVDAQWTASAGNVFSRHIQDFDIEALTASFGVGLRTRRIGPAPIELTFAFGTSRFDEPFDVENFRVYFSTTDGL